MCTPAGHLVSPFSELQFCIKCRSLAPGWSGAMASERRGCKAEKLGEIVWRSSLATLGDLAVFELKLETKIMIRRTAAGNHYLLQRHKQVNCGSSEMLYRFSWRLRNSLWERVSLIRTSVGTTGFMSSCSIIAIFRRKFSISPRANKNL